VAKVTGAARFTVDLRVPGMAHARILRSPYPHARIRSVDASRARSLPGVVAVVSAADLGDLALRYGHTVMDHPLIADRVVRFAGEPVVGVVADEALTAEAALEEIEVEYEPLPFVTDPLEALAAGAPLVHGDSGSQRESNLLTTTAHGWGELDAGFAAAALIVEGEYDYPMAYAYAMEPYTALASWQEGQLTVWSSAQHPFMVRADLCRVFGLPLASVRVSVPYVGGGFGSKSYTKIEPLAAALALRAGRPVRLALSVEESILTTRSVPATCRVRTAFDPDGRILAREADILMNAGAYAENAPRVAEKAVRRLCGPYRIPAARVVGRTVYTNTVPGSSYRGLGGPQATFAGESQLDEAAGRLGIDAIELRRRNLLSKGEPPWPGARPLDADLGADLEIVGHELARPGPTRAGSGRAISIASSDAGAEPTASAIVRLLSDASVIVHCGSAEMGQGSSTVLAQIAAAELGVELEHIHLVQSDTAAASYDRSTGASRTTTIMGLAVQRAAADVRRQLRDWASAGTDGRLDPGDERGGVTSGTRFLSWDSIVRDWFGGVGEVIGVGYVRREGTTEQLPLFWEVSCLGVEVDVDRDTGIVRVARIVSVGDVGRAIHPQMAEGQDVGGAVMGMGVALREELRYEDGSLVNGNLYDYRFPRITDLPDVVSFLAERGDGVGPYGAKGGGEAAVNPIAPAIANALEAAAGIRLRRVPLTPERVWRALREREAELDPVVARTAADQAADPGPGAGR
jgi:CO/xanthine dehydrogenase Mo-binding subunit